MKTISDTIARLFIFGCFMYVMEGGVFSPWTAFGAYYGFAFILFVFNVVFSKVLTFKQWKKIVNVFFKKVKDCTLSTLLNIIFDSLSSVFSFNSFDLKQVHGKNSENCKLNHISSGAKQFLYTCLCSLIMLM